MLRKGSHALPCVPARRYDSRVCVLAEEIPAALVRLLAPGGRMVLTVQSTLLRIDRLTHCIQGGSRGDSADRGTGGGTASSRADFTSGASCSSSVTGAEGSWGLPVGYTAAVVYEGAGFTPLQRSKQSGQAP